MLSRIRQVEKAATTTRAELIDELMDRYVDWREQAGAVQTTYEMWSHAPKPQQKLAFQAFRAALDLEEHASLLYADRVNRLERELALALVQERNAA